MPSFDVCAGGTVDENEDTITFTNHRPSSCTLSDDGSGMSLSTLTGNSSIVVPAKGGQPPVNGSVTVNILSSAAAGTYAYGTSCCNGKRQNPSIIYQ
jgi:hypothetical protein